MSDDEQVSNIFDESRPKTGPVPVVVQIGKDKRVVGSANLEIVEGGIGVSMNLKTDDPNDALKFLQGGVTGISMRDDIKHDISYADAEALFEFEAHEHRPLQHRDGKPPWCEVCGLDVDFKKPESRIAARPHKPPTNFGFPQPPGPINRKKETE